MSRRSVLQEWYLPLKIDICLCQYWQHYRSCTYPRRKSTDSQWHIARVTTYLWLQSTGLSSM